MAQASVRKPTPVETGRAGKVFILVLVLAAAILLYYLVK